MPEDLKKYPHVAYKVEDLAAELKGCDRIVMQPAQVSPTTKIAFAWRDGVLFELMECSE